jgi:tRNA(Ser,Leu) C12 N-acetylase TAN1
LKLINYQDSQIKQLQTKLKQFEIEEGKKYELIFKLKYEGITFFFFKTESNLYFVPEKVLDEEFKKVLFSNESIKTYDYINDIVKREETINLMMKQYEDRMNRLNTELVNSENKFFQANKNYKNSVKEVEDYKKTFDDLRLTWENSIKEVIQSRYNRTDISSDISNQMKNLGEVDLSDDNVRKQVFNEIKEEINKFSSQHEYQWLNELRMCISKNFLSFLDLTNKNLSLERHIESQKVHLFYS